MNSTETTEKSTFEEIWRQLNHNQRRFVVAMLDSESKKDAAEAIGIQPDTVYRWPSIVDDAVALLGRDVKNSVVDILASGAAKAAMIKLAGLDSKDENMRQKIASEVLDRILGKAIDSIDVTTGGEKLHVTDDQRVAGIMALYDAIRARTLSRISDGESAVDAGSPQQSAD